MKYIFIAAMAIIVGMTAAYAGGFMLLHVGSADGSGGTPLTNLRITNTGVFRITDSGNNRAVSP